MDDQLKLNLTRGKTWMRGLFILLFALFYSLAEIVMGALVVVQFGFLLITGGKNRKLLQFGAELSRYIYEVYLYLSFNRDERPYPFADWPEAEVDESVIVAEPASEEESEPEPEIEPESKPAPKKKAAVKKSRSSKPSDATDEPSDGG